MPTLEFETTIAAPLEKVWEFHDDPTIGLPALSPPEANAKIELADLPIREGSRVVVTAKDPLGRNVRMAVKIVEHRPPHDVVFGREARFVDEMESGPFAYWRHEHDFERIDEKNTRVLDRLTYRVPFGPIGWIADWVFVRRQIRAMFAHRHAMTHRLLDQKI